ncbi:MAG: TIGR03960 family B12-binding radical SAM protein [Candidatus Brocadiia bacterium]|jgi:radical SAM family uncharacterized protein|nr:TIGR03960 family B12-binding radical SAM protein [Candidatus Brocadiia bacterium]
MKARITDPKEIHAVLERRVLADVEHPAQYVGGEVGSVRKDPGGVEVSLALCFPDLYTVGMSNLGLQILYSLVNGIEWAAAERAYAPWPDMQERMREHGIPLYALESFRPVRDFDLVGFSLQTELLYTNALLMLELAGVPLLSAERGPDDPIVIAGGPSTVNPEPMAEFIDLFLIGDGEESVIQLLELVRGTKGRGASRRDAIVEAARHVPGAYAPALYEVSCGADGLLAAVWPVSEYLPERITIARVGELEAAHVPLQPIVPFVETVHDRITLEIMRGCPHRCRFCQAAMVSRPVRTRSADALVEAALATYAATGHGEIALCSLSSSDYPRLPALLERLAEAFSPLGVSLSLPSLRVSDQLDLLVGPLSSVRKAGLTFAPEAASERLRGVINKKVTDEELLSGTAAAVGEGWRVIKLYFMLGLPTEAREDVLAIPELCRRLLRSAALESSGRGLKVNVTLSPFVPKPHTPFQWEPMTPLEAIREKLALVFDDTRTRKVRYKAHLAERSVVEALLARGDRRLGRVLRRVRELGGMFDAWDEHFSFERWTRALDDCGIRLDDSADPNSPFRERGADEVLPWDHIDCRVKKTFLLAERERALGG